MQHQVQLRGYNPKPGDAELGPETVDNTEDESPVEIEVEKGPGSLEPNPSPTEDEKYPPSVN